MVDRIRLSGERTGMNITINCSKCNKPFHFNFEPDCDCFDWENMDFVIRFDPIDFPIKMTIHNLDEKDMPEEPELLNQKTEFNKKHAESAYVPGQPFWRND